MDGGSHLRNCEVGRWFVLSCLRFGLLCDFIVKGVRRLLEDWARSVFYISEPWRYD